MSFGAWRTSDIRGTIEDLPAWHALDGGDNFHPHMLRKKRPGTVDPPLKDVLRCMWQVLDTLATMQMDTVQPDAAGLRM
eukprot:5052855-Amphidinium_carterae.1